MATQSDVTITYKSMMVADKDVYNRTMRQLSKRARSCSFYAYNSNPNFSIIPCKFINLFWECWIFSTIFANICLAALGLENSIKPHVNQTSMTTGI